MECAAWVYQRSASLRGSARYLQPGVSTLVSVTTDTTAGKEIVMGRAIVSDDVELEVRRMCEELQRRALTGAIVWQWAKPNVQALIEGRASAPFNTGDQASAPRHPKSKCDLAEGRRSWFETWYRSHGFTTVAVPKSNVTNREFARRAKKRQVLVYSPATSEVSYESFMAAVGQGSHWTVTNQDERAKISWEPCVRGYWFWAEIRDNCPRLGKTWNDLVKQIRLHSLEEYVIVWHATKAETGCMLDVRTWPWLRTRFGPGALLAYGCVGGVLVDGRSAESLSVPFGNGGGRALDVVG